MNIASSPNRSARPGSNRSEAKPDLAAKGLSSHRQTERVSLSAGLSRGEPESTTLVTGGYHGPGSQYDGTLMTVVVPFVTPGIVALGAKLGWSAGLSLGSAVGGAAAGLIAGGLAAYGATESPIGAVASVGGAVAGAYLAASFSSVSPLIGGAAGYLLGGFCGVAHEALR